MRVAESSHISKNKLISQYACLVIVLVGRKGNLSRALQREFYAEEIRIFGSDVANSWAIDGGDEQIEIDLESLEINPRLIINTAGLLNPNSNLSRLLDVNFQLPKNLEFYSRKRGIKLVTFGSIMENLDDLSKSNPYLLSKRQYFEFFKKEVLPNTTSLHLQIHTWYGGVSPHPHMFLGQMFSALKKRAVFEMSDGIQLREYHNIFDDIAATQYLLNQDAKGIIQINHGQSLPLREIAISVFDAFNSRDFLKIGSLKSPDFEIIEKRFETPKLLEEITFRETCPGIIDDFRRLLGEGN